MLKLSHVFVVFRDYLEPVISSLFVDVEIEVLHEIIRDDKCIKLVVNKNETKLVEQNLAIQWNIVVGIGELGLDREQAKDVLVQSVTLSFFSKQLIPKVFIVKVLCCVDLDWQALMMCNIGKPRLQIWNVFG